MTLRLMITAVALATAACGGPLAPKGCLPPDGAAAAEVARDGRRAVVENARRLADLERFSRQSRQLLHARADWRSTLARAGSPAELADAYWKGLDAGETLEAVDGLLAGLFRADESAAVRDRRAALLVATHTPRPGAFADDTLKSLSAERAAGVRADAPAVGRHVAARWLQLQRRVAELLAEGSLSATAAASIARLDPTRPYLPTLVTAAAAGDPGAWVFWEGRLANGFGELAASEAAQPTLAKLLSLVEARGAVPAGAVAAERDRQLAGLSAGASRDWAVFAAGLDGSAAGAAADLAALLAPDSRAVIVARLRPPPRAVRPRR